MSISTRQPIAALLGLMTASSAAGYTYNASDFAVEVMSAANLPATSIYNDPSAVLGRPTMWFNNSANPNVSDIRRSKLIEAPFNLGPNGERLLTTLTNGAQVTVRMGRPVTNDRSHLYGIDFIVFGNAFFAGSGNFVGDDANLNLDVLTGQVFGERVKVSVSPDNLNWYTYDAGPYGDGAFPTNSYVWNSTLATWSDIESDPTLPVNPALFSSVAGKDAGTVLDRIYKGSAGGTGFDLAPSGFKSIQYIRFEGAPGFANGEIDAVAAVNGTTPEPTVLAVLTTAIAVATSRRRGPRMNPSASSGQATDERG